MFELFADAKALVAAAKAGDYAAVMRLAGKFLTLGADLFGPPKVGAAAAGADCTDEQLDECCREVAACVAETTFAATGGVPAPAAVGAAPVGLNPAVILAALQAAKLVLEWVRERRKQAV